MRERFCRNCRGWHRDGEWPRACYEALYARPEPANLPLPFIRRDNMNALWHPANGKEYDSRSDYDAVTKEHGLMEIGNESLDHIKPPADDSIKADVVEAYQKVSQGYRPHTEATSDATTGWQEPA